MPGKTLTKAEKAQKFAADIIPVGDTLFDIVSEIENLTNQAAALSEAHTLRARGFSSTTNASSRNNTPGKEIAVTLPVNVLVHLFVWTR